MGGGLSQKAYLGLPILWLPTLHRRRKPYCMIRTLLENVALSFILSIGTTAVLRRGTQRGLDA
ncbi:hypothetical protein BDM02DRAFT_3117845 [Thelephora ganbajun]|uniref:Uncharacterized protein n=1 Tax=Thelephora ganbajun TaxID=370292 RepID=A0ACB6ZBC3_THEGA|nr:hypothetical protein BDM02DRAFT_3117845 [Thelephora ganbajun]